MVSPRFVITQLRQGHKNNPKRLDRCNETVHESEQISLCPRLFGVIISNEGGNDRKPNTNYQVNSQGLIRKNGKVIVKEVQQNHSFQTSHDERQCDGIDHRLCYE